MLLAETTSFIAALVKKPHTIHTPLIKHCIIWRVGSVVLYVQQFVQHLSLHNQVQGLQSCPQHRTSLLYTPDSDEMDLFKRLTSAQAC